MSKPLQISRDEAVKTARFLLVVKSELAAMRLLVDELSRRCGVTSLDGLSLNEWFDRQRVREMERESVDKAIRAEVGPDVVTEVRRQLNEWHRPEFALRTA